MRITLFVTLHFLLVACGSTVKESEGPQTQGRDRCQLESPLDVGMNDIRVPREKVITLTNVEFYELPQTLLLRKSWHEVTNSWEIFLFEIYFNQKPTGFLGFYIDPQQGHNVGFGYDYGGALPSISGKAEIASQGAEFSTSEPESEEGSKDELKVETSGGKIISIEIMVPNYGSKKSGVSEFKGNEVLCVKAATLKAQP